jgi:hypothetical protein
VFQSGQLVPELIGGERRPALAAWRHPPEAGRLRPPAGGPRRRGRHRPDLTGAAGPLAGPRTGPVLRLPALARLLRTAPADELADRYPGRLAGTIGDAALPSPDSQHIIIGHTAAQAAQMARTEDTIAVSTIAFPLLRRITGPEVARNE